jgi:hypothetical protein
LLIAKNIATSPADASRSSRSSLISEPRTSKGGPLLPGLCSPSSSSLSSILAASRGPRTPVERLALKGHRRLRGCSTLAPSD